MSLYKLPQGSEKWNKAMLGAFKKGIEAHSLGAPIGACPYKDTRKQDGRLSWSRAFIGAWTAGWRWSNDGQA